MRHAVFSSTLCECDYYVSHYNLSPTVTICCQPKRLATFDGICMFSVGPADRGAVPKTSASQSNVALSLSCSSKIELRKGSLSDFKVFKFVFIAVTLRSVQNCVEKPILC